jgi:hypothetical protein
MDVVSRLGGITIEHNVLVNARVNLSTENYPVDPTKRLKSILVKETHG